MPPSFLASTGSVNSATLFEIRLDNSTLVFQGERDNATSTLLKGTLVLCLSEPLKISNIHMRLTGEAKLEFQYATPGVYVQYHTAKQKREFFRESWTFESSGATLPAGNYEYPFEAILPGSLPESIEGLPGGTWVIYRMKATIDRGLLASNIYTRKHVRIVRTFDASSLELVHSMSIENIWPDKLQYCISTPSKAVIFGTSVPIDFEMISLLKGLKLGEIKTELQETYEFVTDTPPKKDFILKDKTVGKDEWTFPEDAETEDINGQEGWKFSRVVQIPKSLTQCRQTVEEKGIKIKHKIRFTIALLNPDGHVSELRAVLPIHIFISPNLPIDENNNLVNQSSQTAQMIHELNNQAPPLYGEHQLDPLYSDVDPTGYMTPAMASGAVTPFASASRRGSRDNLASLNTIGEISPNSLENRLSNLQPPSSSRWGRERSYTSGPDTPSHLLTREEEESGSHSVPIPRIDYFTNPDGTPNHGSPNDPHTHRQSEEDVSDIPQHIELSTAELSRVPSYNTAIQTPARRPFSQDLPNYISATSRPPSPLPTTPQITTQARTGSIQESGRFAPLEPTRRAMQDALGADRRPRILQTRLTH